jgi:hypothetical protein
MKWSVRISLALATIATRFSATGAPAAKAVSHMLAATPAVGRVSAVQAHLSALAAEMAYVTSPQRSFQARLLRRSGSAHI